MVFRPLHVNMEVSFGYGFLAKELGENIEDVVEQGKLCWYVTHVITICLWFISDTGSHRSCHCVYLPVKEV